MTSDFPLSFRPSPPSRTGHKLAIHVQDNNVARRRRALDWAIPDEDGRLLCATLKALRFACN